MRITSLLAILFFILTAAPITSAQEINFIDQDWEAAKKQAMEEGKYLFVDAYTDWCYWCKVMDKNTFSDPAVASTMNEKFVSLKLDMEKGIGIDVAMKYHVSGFPTFLIFTPEMNVVYRIGGYEPPEVFLESLTAAVDPARQIAAEGFGPDLDPGFPAFYRAAFEINKKGKREFPDQKEVNKFLSKQQDLKDEVSWAVMLRFGTNAEYEQYFWDNIKDYERLYGVSSVQRRRDNIFYMMFNVAASEKSMEKMAALEKLVRKYVIEDTEDVVLQYKIRYCELTEDWTGFCQHITKFMDGNKERSPSIVNSVCWNIYEKVDDQKYIQKAIDWMKVAVDKDAAYAHVDTYAALFFKAGQMANAEEWALKAIEIAEKNGEKYEETSVLLDKIRAAKGE